MKPVLWPPTWATGLSGETSGALPLAASLGCCGRSAESSELEDEEDGEKRSHGGKSALVFEFRPADLKGSALEFKLDDAAGVDCGGGVA